MNTTRLQDSDDNDPAGENVNKYVKITQVNGFTMFDRYGMDDKTIHDTVHQRCENVGITNSSRYYRNVAELNSTRQQIKLIFRSYMNRNQTMSV